MTANPNLKIAAKRLKEISANTTDSTAFKVRDDIVPHRIYLVPDEERRLSGAYPETSVFYHAAEVVDICRALGLSFWIEGRVENGKTSFEVNIY